MNSNPVYCNIFFGVIFMCEEKGRNWKVSWQKIENEKYINMKEKHETCMLSALYAYHSELKYIILLM